MGFPEIKYGDSVCFVQHVASTLWLTYKAQDAKTSRLGPLKRKVKRTFVFLFHHLQLQITCTCGCAETHTARKYCTVFNCLHCCLERCSVNSFWA